MNQPQSAVSFEHRLMAVADLHHDTENPRARNPRNLAAIKASINEHGQVEPVVVQKSSNRVIHGNGRLKVMGELGFTEVACAVLDVDDTQARKLSIVLNRSGELAGWDDEILSAHLADLLSYDPDFDPGTLGFSDDELDALLTAPSETDENIYTAKVESPIYEVTGECPDVSELYDQGKALALIERIMSADIDDDLREFLVAAAKRHTGFRYDLIAEYYAHAPADVQALMEESALVIIDFNQAVERGFVKLTADLADAYQVDHG